jgi:DNA-binding protein H-NS
MNMSTDLNGLSLAELKSLQKYVAKAIATFEDRRRQEALAVVKAAAREQGFDLSELFGGAPARKRKPARAKYAHPENGAVTWTGRGRKPKWVADFLAKGRKLEDLAI